MIEDKLEKLADETINRGKDEEGTLLFAGKMLKILREANKKGKRRWWESSTGYLLWRLKEEIDELFKELPKIDLGSDPDKYEDNNNSLRITTEQKRELLDIANFCMMLHQK